jgi:hypothetical protein
LLGAGIFNRGRLVATNVLVAANASGSPNRRRPGGKGRTAGADVAGGGIYNTGVITFAAGVVRGNRAVAGGGQVAGGGVYNAGTVRFLQTTLSDNLTRSDGAQAEGGGLYVAPGSDATVLTRTLVQGNEAGTGGGIFFGGGKGVTLVTSVVRSNRPNNCAPAGTIAGCVARGPARGAPTSGRGAPTSGRG